MPTVIVCRRVWKKRDKIPKRIVYIKEKDGCFTGCLKLGCGSIIAIWLLSALFGFIFLIKDATIHTGMPKDSVIILLGQPTAFDCSDYWDQITYNYGEMGLSSLIIKFEDGKVSSVRKDDNEHLYENVKKHLK